MYEANMLRLSQRISNAVNHFSTAMMSGASASLTEGSAIIPFSNPNEVFYNPVQQFNRDLSVTAIRAWSETRSKKIVAKSHHRHQLLDQNSELSQENLTKCDTTHDFEKNCSEKTDSTSADNIAGFTILEALSATGLRSIRYAKELPNVKRILANDLLENAVKTIEKNVNYNNVSDIVIPNKGDANAVMHMNKFHYDVIDLDPYGSAAPFLDAAVQSVSKDGLLCITCTDSAVLAGNAYPEKCFSNYGGSSLRSNFCHEQAVRHLLYAIAASAAKYGRAIKPLLSLSIDFYFRVFVQIKAKPVLVKNLQSQSLLIYHCSGCGTFAEQPLGKTSPGRLPGTTKFSNASGPPVSANCEHCGYVHHVGGPLWGGPLHDAEFLKKMRAIAEDLDPEVYGTKRRILGMLALADEELPDVPFYFVLSQICSVLRSQSPPQNIFVSALLNAGYRVSGSHAKSNAIKTNAPWSFVWDVLRSWIKDHPVKLENISKTSAGAAILEKTPTAEVDFTFRPDSEFASKKEGYTRYQMNPTENWGPKSKPGKRTIAEVDSKS
nr:tRNA (Guanine-N2-)-Methyltransferase [Schizosaccharomyces pombe]